MDAIITDRIRESIETKEKILADNDLLILIQSAANSIYSCLQANGKVLFCGNGGSASDALHLTAELTGRFQRERRAYSAICLNANMAELTAVANDYGYEAAFARATEGLMTPSDVLVGISTSGNSKNIRRAILKAKEIGGATIALLGRDGGKIKDIADISIVIPSDNTARIQESHIMIGHIICELVENAMVENERE